MAGVEIAMVVLGVYLLIGVLFAAVFVIAGASRIDPAAVGAGVRFRVLLLPGSAMLWPVLAYKWATAPKRGGS